MPLIKIIRRRTLLYSALAAVAGVLSISACSTEENPPAGSLTLVTAPTSINVVPGGTGNATATITRGGSFTGAVTLSATGAPAGVTATFNPAQIAAGSNTATINVAVDAGVATGNKTITINAAASGVTTATATLTVVVVSAANGAIALAAAPTALTAAVGAAVVTSAITITRTAPFAGAVALTVTGAPAYLNATLNPTSAPGATSTLSVQAVAGAVNGTYPLVIHGTGTGVADATTIVNVTVTGGATAGASFTFSPTPLPLTAGGASATSTVTIARTGTFVGGALNLTLSGAPAGLTATIAPNSNVTANTAVVTAQASGAVAAGTYNLVLTGVGTGIPNAVGTLPVNVTGGGGGGSVSFTFCAEDAPVWVAIQDGAAGAWTHVTPTSGSTYQFNFPSGKGGVATVDTVGAGTDLSVLYGTLAEFTAGTSTINNGGCNSAKTLNGSVSGVGATEFASVNLGGSTAFVPGVGSTAFVLNNVPAGPQDLVATRLGSTQLVNWIIIRRALNPASGSTLPVLAFGTEGFLPASANVTVTGLGSDTASIVSLFTGVRGANFSFLSSIADYVAATPAQPFAAIPSGNLQANELQELLAFSNEQNNENSERSAGLYFTTVSNRTVALGPKLSTPTVTKVVTAPNARPNVLLVSQTQYNRLITADYSQSNNRSATVLATAGYFGGVPGTWNVTVPDLSGATGWNTNWGLADGTPIDWTVSAQGGAIPFLDASIADGSASQSASITSSAPLNLRGLRSGNEPGALQRRLLDVLEEGRIPSH